MTGPLDELLPDQGEQTISLAVDGIAIEFTVSDLQRLVSKSVTVTQELQRLSNQGFASEAELIDLYETMIGNDASEAD